MLVVARGETDQGQHIGRQPRTAAVDFQDRLQLLEREFRPPADLHHDTHGFPATERDPYPSADIVRRHIVRRQVIEQAIERGI